MEEENYEKSALVISRWSCTWTLLSFKDRGGGDEDTELYLFQVYDGEEVAGRNGCLKNVPAFGKSGVYGIL